MANSAESVIWGAIQSLVLTTHDKSDSTNPAGKPSSKASDNKIIYPCLAPSSHEYPEVALPVFGTPYIEINGKWHKLSPGRFAAITPGVEHIEGCASAKDGYTLLWLIFSKRTMMLLASQHIPQKGWHTFMSRSLNSPKVNILRKLIQYGGQDFTPQRTDKIRANILTVLAELYEKEITTSEKLSSCQPGDKYDETLDSLHDFIDTHYAGPISVESLARMAGISTCYLNRLFKKKFGLGIQEQIISTRMYAALEMLKTGNFMIKQIALKCGYDDPLYFSKAFKKYYGYPPSTRTGKP